LSIERDDQLSEVSLRAIANAKNLKWLNLSGGNWRRRMHNLLPASLTYLDARKCNLVDEDIDDIAKMKSLEELDVSDNPLLSERSLIELEKLKNIKRLRLSANAFDSDKLVSFLRRIGSKKVSFRTR
jgi:Leucine-rich repeat (LRR) protein